MRKHTDALVLTPLAAVLPARMTHVDARQSERVFDDLRCSVTLASSLTKCHAARRSHQTLIQTVHAVVD